MIRETEYNKPWIAQRADPYVIKKDGKYYFTASVPAYDCIAIKCADTLEGISTAEDVIVWRKHESGVMSKHVWAPELHYIDGKWYIYFAAGEKDEIWKIRPFILECSGQNPVKDSWFECGIMKAADDDEFSFRSFSLDMTIFECKGKNYAIWAEKVGVGRMISNLYIAEMESPYKMKSVQVLLTTPDYDWERIGYWVNEGPAILKHNGRIFVTFSCSATGACYCVGMIEADENSDLLDPLSWHKNRYPVLKTNEELGIYGPGHNSFTKSDDNKNDVMVFHFRQYSDITGDPLYDPNRHAKYLTVKWNEKGSPVFEYSI